MRIRLAIGTATLVCAGLAPAASATTLTVGAGALRAEVQDAPWLVRFVDETGATVLEQRAGRGLGASGPLGVTFADRAALRREGDAVVATLTAGGRALEVRVSPAGDGVIRIAAAGAGSGSLRMGFAAADGERFWGFGERSNAVDHRGGEVESRVSDGPVREEDRNYPRAVVPPWGIRDRDDSTYYPVPWLLSSRGHGVLVDEDTTSLFRLGSERRDEWSVEAESPTLGLRVFAGPRPADALRRFTAAVGRQPPAPTPWTFGPWFQTGQPNTIPLEEEAQIIKRQRDADVPVSAAETQMHFLPCGAHRGNEDYEKKRTQQFHAAGLAHMAYFNPHLCASYQPVFNEASAAGLLQRAPGGAGPFTYPTFVGGSGPAGFTSEPLAQFDFTAPGTEAFYERLVREAFDQGKDGWMEDFGEYTPDDVVSADGTPGVQMHNRYPDTYHCTVQRIAGRLDRPVVRFQRSGWTGGARCSVNVWGGDPTTVWGFDGLESAVTQAIGMGLSGVSRWGSDIGGYNSYGPGEQLSRELLERWIQFGAVSGVMRTKRSGIAIPSYARPQVFDPDSLPIWRRYTKLHTQLYPYLLAADAHYRRTGVPLMRHLALTHPDDARSLAVDDAFGFGPDLLAAPVTTPGAKDKKLYAPPGTWVDWWRSVRYDEDTGAYSVRGADLLQGGREHTLPAPRTELPLLVRAGAVLPLLSADVDTLADYGDAPGLVKLRDREDRMTLLAFPRGRSVSRVNEDERVGSTEGRKRRRWVLTVSGDRERTYDVQAALSSLERPFVPRRVSVGGRVLSRRSWSYDATTRVLRVTMRVKRATLRVERR